MRYLLLTAITAATLMTTTSCGMLGGNKVMIPSEDDLRREYKASQADFKAKYDGKEISAWGKASVMDLSAPVIVHFDNSGSDSSVDGTPYISCYVDSADVARFKELKVDAGDYMRLKGTMKLETGSMRLDHCKLDKIGIYAMSDE